MKLVNKLATLVGSTFMIHSRNQKVVGWLVIEETNEVIIGTTLELFRLPVETADSYIKINFLPVEEANGIFLPAAGSDSKPLIESLLDKLTKNIDMIQERPEFIRQANAINGTVAQITNLMKTKIQHERIAK